MMERLRKSIVLFAIICSTTVYGIVNIDPEKKEKIDNFVNSLFSECETHRNVVGMNLAIVYEGEILYTTRYGVKNLGRLSVFF